MFGTIVAVFDGYSRSLSKVVQIIRHGDDERGFKKRYIILVMILAVGSIIVVFQFGEKLKELVDFATTVSFLVAPVIAIFNYRLVTGKYLAREAKPPVWIKVLSVMGIAFLIGFALFFVYTKFF